jgi:hypothetical protein
MQERMEVVVAEIAQNYQSLYDLMLEVQRLDEEMSYMLLEEFTHQWEDFKFLKRENPELAELEVAGRTLEIRIELLAHQLHEVAKDAKETIKQELKELVGQLFQLKISKRELEISTLQQELDQMMTELEQIVQKKEEHIERKLKELTEGDVFMW